MSEPRQDRIERLQCEGGGFEAFVRTRAGETRDVNAFTTACVLRALRSVPGATPARVTQRALDFLESCAATSPPGAYGFWPEGRTPAWATRVPPDVDDTALVVVELLRHGRMSRESALRTLCRVLLPCRLSPHAARMLPSWVVPGCFETWLAPAGAARGMQVVDACVNVNVAALMAMLDAAHLPGYREACATVEAGLAWAGEDAARLASLTPFYPSLEGFADALAHATTCGAALLASAARRVGALARARCTGRGPCCSSAYGHVTWRCAALDDARAMGLAAAA